MISSIAKFSLALTLGLTSATFSFANDAHHPPTENQASEAATSVSEGEVRKIDKENSKITIRHGELKNLGMPPMTMVFRVKDAAMLEQVKVGDKIKFVADKVGAQFTVIQLDVQK
jgi:Cu/Ag efflux protein CusF